MSSRVNLDRPQVFLENPIELLTTTETETPRRQHHQKL